MFYFSCFIFRVQWKSIDLIPLDDEYSEEKWILATHNKNNKIPLIWNITKEILILNSSKNMLEKVNIVTFLTYR